MRRTERAQDQMPRAQTSTRFERTGVLEKFEFEADIRTDRQQRREAQVQRDAYSGCYDFGSCDGEAHETLPSQLVTQ